ncbi:hypothetical protein Cni_G09863 [Canna indica]|uniref:DDT domain-containing protein n=1 Tax=Canna indica TaxID=4628 RepID=A0AAQ3K360_9LILI|nr:hypothetical protein Cni_G09863 [Canna indica]
MLAACLTSFRYGENAEEVSVQENWSCPKCRGVCNCSFCMKKKGQKPTGMLIHAAKATGFTSVHELLDNKGSEALIAANGLRSLSAGNFSAYKKGSVAMKRSHDKDNCDEEQNGTQGSVGVGDNKDGSVVNKKKTKTSKKRKCPSETGGENITQFCDGDTQPTGVNTQDNDSKKVSAKSRKLEKKPKKEPVPTKKSNGGKDISTNTDEVELSDSKNDILQDKPARKGQKIQKNGTKKSNSNESKMLTEMQNQIVKTKALLKEAKPTKFVSRVPSEHENTHVIPQGTPLTEVAGSEWTAEEVGAALQFLEFCNSFSEVLDVKKGEAECVLRELTRGRVGSRGIYSSVVKFHIKLLSFISKDTDDENNGEQWFESLSKYINESDCVLKMPLDCLKMGTLLYDSLDLSDKLRLLNFLCDLTLGTEELRSWIEKENDKYIERNKEAKEIIIAAKKKGNDLKKKLKDDVARAMLSLKDGPLSVVEHEKLVSRIKAETEKAHAEMLEITGQLPKNTDNIRRDAVRTEPMFLEGGRIYWKLAGFYDNSKIILQDVGNSNSGILEDQWFAYDEEEEKAIDRKRMR